jgi:hypothetical protein
MRDKQKKFVQLAEARVNSVLKNIELIGNLSNKRNYEYTDEQANKIILVLESEIKELRSKFKSANKPNGRFML